MSVSELIAKLSTFQPDAEVLITDGFKCLCYRGDYDVEAWMDDAGKVCVDIGLGGCEEE